MTKLIKSLRIDDCSQCPSCKLKIATGRYFCLQPIFKGQRILTNKKDRALPIPVWCPLYDYKDYDD